MSDRDRHTEDDMDQRVRQASGGEPEAGVRAEESDEAGETAPNRGAAGKDAPETVREEDSRAATERVERMQQEGKGMGGTPTDTDQGRST